jgi:hypothetical protein
VKLAGIVSWRRAPQGVIRYDVTTSIPVNAAKDRYRSPGCLQGREILGNVSRVWISSVCIRVCLLHLLHDYVAGVIMAI